MGEEKNIVYDVWGGDLYMDHLARYACSVQTAAAMMPNDLADGYLVNLRRDLAWGAEGTFDVRAGAA